MSKGNFTTGAQRYNNRMNRIFEDAKILKAKVRDENIKYLCSIGYNMPGIGTYSDEIIGKLAYNHKNEVK